MSPEQKESCGFYVEQLQRKGWTLDRIAGHIGVSDRQVSNWKNGDRPKGMSAIRLFLLYEEICLNRTRVHSQMQVIAL